MSKKYDNWERLVTAVMRRERDKQIALSHSRDPSTISSISSSEFDDDDSELTLDHKTIALRDGQELVWRSAYLCFWVDKRTGKNCLMLGARKLTMSWVDDSRYWKWTSHDDSRFPKVAELKEVIWWLDIRGKVETRMLSPETMYAAFLVLKLAEVENAMIGFPDDESDEDAEKWADIVHLQTMGSIQEQIAVIRADGWMELELGYFYFDLGDQREVEARLLEPWTWKRGLIVEGIELRPRYTLSSFVSKNKQVKV